MRGRYKISPPPQKQSTARSGKTNDVASLARDLAVVDGGCGPRLFSGTHLFEETLTLLLTLRWGCLISHGDNGGAKGRRGGEDDVPTATGETTLQLDRRRAQKRGMQGVARVGGM